MEKKPRHRRMPWKRIITAIIAILLLSGATLLWILNSEHRIQGDWSNILPISFTVLGVLFAFLAWLFPFSSAQPETPLLPLASELVRGSFRMGDEAAANFPYITAPIQEAYRAATETLLGISRSLEVDKQGILILGEANAGKTRLTFEALTQTLPKWPVLRWRPDYTIEKALLGEIRRNKRLVIFIDDLQDYVSSLRRDSDSKFLIGDSRTTTLLSLIETLFQDVQKVMIVATCRLEDETRVRAELGQLFAKLTIIQLRRFNVDTNNPEVARIITDFQRHGSSHTEDWDGTLGSLVLGLSTKNSEYLKMQNDLAAIVLRAMKLLARAYVLVHTEKYLRKVCTEVFREKDFLTNEKTWQEAVNQLVLKQFITEEVDEVSHEVTLVIRKDSYFDRVITDYPSSDRPHQLFQDFARLQNVFVSLRAADALVSLGIALVELKRDQEAMDAYEQAIHLDPTSAATYISKGYALVELKRDQEALDALEQAIHLDPTSADAYISKGYALAELKRYEESLDALEQAIHLGSTSTDIYISKGLTLVDLERYEEALDAYEQAIHLDPTAVTAYNGKGITFRFLIRDQEALDAFEQAIRLDPTVADAYINKGDTLVELERYEEALDAYEQAIHLDPTAVTAYIDKGDVLRYFKRYEESLDAFEQAIRLDPTVADACNGKGLTLVELERYEEALDAFEQAIHLDPTVADAYNGKGYALRYFKRYEEALDTYEQAIHLDPISADAYSGKGYALGGLERYEEALDALEQAIHLDRTFADVYSAKGYALMYLKRYEEALDAFEQAIHLDRTFAAAYNGKGVTLERLGKNKQAQQAYNRAHELGFSG